MEIPEVDTDTAAKHLEEGEALFLDIRDPQSFATSHIPGAVNLGDGNLREFLDDADRSKKTIVYCYHGNSSLGGTAFLMEQGFEDVQSMSGGFEAWRGRFPEE